ncbi:MAG: glycosyltransferase family 4 protein [Acidobacteriota bacterium]
MKIAVVGPSPVPFTFGGAESVLLGISSAILRWTPHEVEIIKVPSRELSFWDLIETYRSFYRLNLDHFDRIISTKYPAWMVQHRDHSAYIPHRLRGLYDTYSGLLEFDRSTREARAVVELLSRPKGADFPNLLFAALEEMRQAGGTDLADVCSFPGPFIRTIIHSLDDWALAPERIRRFFAISKTVARRPGYFPPGVPVEVVYHPPYPEGFSTGEPQYFFTASRLDRPKRLHLVIEAFKQSSSPYRLLIAGEGPEKQHLMALAGDDARIEFLGFVSNDALRALYSGAIAVIFIPEAEDFGLIVLEAMMSGKPVITCEDSGGPTEFVQDGINGFTVPAEAGAIAEKIDWLSQDLNRSAELGRGALQSVSEVNWRSAIGQLLHDRIPRNTRVQRKPRMVVFSTYPICPPRNGGQNRVFFLYRELASHFDVEVVSLTDNYFATQNIQVTPSFRLRSFVMDDRSVREVRALESRCGRTLYDIFAANHYRRSRAFYEYALKSAGQADILVSEHPYLFPILAEFTGKTLIYDAHNLELLLKSAYLGPENRQWIDTVREVEEAACRLSNLVWFSSEEDRNAAHELYELATVKTVIVPNGVDAESIRFRAAEQVRELKRRFGIPAPVLLFVGSHHPPNNSAVEWVVQELNERPWVTFVLGSVAHHFPGVKRTGNVFLTGEVSESEKKLFCQLADVALNPVTQGSGTNLKTIEYVRFGIPTLSTPVGLRGLDPLRRFAKMADLSDFPAVLERMIATRPCIASLKEGSEWVGTHYGWGPIARRLLAELAWRRMIEL